MFGSMRNRMFATKKWAQENGKVGRIIGLRKRPMDESWFIYWKG